MPNKNIFYDIGNSKVRDVTSSYYDDNNKLFSEKLVFSSASLNLTNGIMFSNNGILSSSVQSDGQILAWDAANSKWSFLSAIAAEASTIPVPANSDITGSFLNNVTVKSISNVQTGTLAVSRGGTGLSSSDFTSGEKLLLSDGSDKFVFANINSGSVNTTSIYDKAIILASLTASSAADQSIYNNTITRVKGQFAAPPVAPPIGGSTVLYSSYDANGANYNASINIPEPHVSDFTMECWAYLSNVGGTPYDVSRSAIMSNNNNFGLNGGGSTQNGTTGFYTVYVSNYDAWTNLPFIVNQWVYLVMVRSQNNFRIYANATGSQIFPVTNMSITNTGKVWTGNSNGNWNPNGYVTEVRYVKYAKTPEEIKTHYQSVLSGSRGRYTTHEMDTRTYSTNNIAVTVNNDGTAVTSSGINPDNINISGLGSYHYP